MNWFDVALDLAWPPLAGFSYALLRSRYGGDFRGRAYVMWAFASAWDIGVDLYAAQWFPMACSGASLVLATWLYWHHRNRRDRAAKLSSAKGRAIIAALVTKAREAARPRPVLVPGGAR